MGKKILTLPEKSNKFKSMKTKLIPFKIPNVDVTSVSEYFALPKNKRTWLGLYKLPTSLPVEFFSNQPGWNTFYREIKKQFPLQWVFRYWMLSFENPVFCTVKRIIWKIRAPYAE